MLERERQLGVVLLLVGRRCGHHGTDVTDGDLMEERLMMVEKSRMEGRSVPTSPGL
jgi:hypothetical protein